MFTRRSWASQLDCRSEHSRDAGTDRTANPAGTATVFRQGGWGLPRHVANRMRPVSI